MTLATSSLLFCHSRRKRGGRRNTPASASCSWKGRLRWVRFVIGIVLFGKIAYYLADGSMRWLRLPRYANRTERRFRTNRFPTVEQRVRLYMAHWYLPPCPVLLQQQHDAALGGGGGGGTTTTTTSASHKVVATIVHVPLRRKNVTTFWSNAPVLQSVPNDIDYTVTEPGVSTDRNFTISSLARPDEVFWFNNDDLYYCYKQKDWSIRFYCRDAQLSMQRSAALADGSFPPIFLEFTDHSQTVVVNRVGDDGETSTIVSKKIDNPNIPVIKKLRTALPRSEIDDIMNNTYNHSAHCQDLTVRQPIQHQSYRQPILWLLNTNRHYQHSLDIPRYDIPWQQKKNSAIFRGELTGLQYDKTASDEENCDHMPRCRLVYHHANSEWVDARLTNTFGKIPDVFHGVNMTGPKLRRYDFLQHKGLIVLEGNDVSSGLKWSMVSNSVVLMPPPTFSSYAMEEMLEPWVHYIPLQPDLTDIEPKVQWMLANEAESKRIAHRAKLWILDLYFHPDAMTDAKMINEEILRRYKLLFE
jgi:Glycosyl transferase family 90